MKIHLTTGVERNFGDELNAWLWPELFPALFDGAADGINFIGIGSILDRRLPASGLNVVLGTGTGYARPPDVQAAPARWRIYGVRGPLTARLMSLPDDAAISDPAILLARHPRWQARPTAGGGTLFVPHWKSVRFGQWPEACAMAGVEFVDPRADAKAVVHRIATARLVIAESMHAAIVADALRVPWIPIVLSREVAPFKWTDWAATVGVEYTPLRLAPSSPLEALRDKVLMHSSFAHIGAWHAQPWHEQPRRTGGPRELAWTREQLLGEHARATARSEQFWRRRASVLAEMVLKRLARLGPALRERFAPGVYPRFLEQAAEQLHQVLASPPRLSNDGAHERALQRCDDAVARLQADRRAGRLASRRAAALPPTPPMQPMPPAQPALGEAAVLPGRTPERLGAKLR
ncbi:MAG: polysaccharide pyruvyl transferase family protein [Burkholderiales bacterium]|nr:polysaccharide pyruvyl transferase family protein [Burkholderiales bacterium]